MRTDTRYYKITINKKVTHIATVRDIVVATNAGEYKRENKWIGNTMDFMAGVAFGTLRSKIEIINPGTKPYEEVVTMLGEIKNPLTRQIINKKIKGLTFGQRLSFFRSRTGITQWQLSEMLGKNDSKMITALENDDPAANPTLKTLEQIGRYLGFKITLARDRTKKPDVKMAFDRLLKSKGPRTLKDRSKQRKIKIRP